MKNWWADSTECCCFCETSKTSWRIGKLPLERRFGEPFKGPIIPFGAMVEYHPISTRDQSRLHQFGKKVLPVIFLGFALIAGGIWKGDTVIADLEELEKTDTSEIYSRRVNAERSTDLTKWRRICIRNSTWYSNVVRERLRIPRTHSKAGTDRKE